MKGEERAYMQILCHFTDRDIDKVLNSVPSRKRRRSRGEERVDGRIEKGRGGRRRGIASAATQDWKPVPLAAYGALSSQLVKLE